MADRTVKRVDWLRVLMGNLLVGLITGLLVSEVLERSTGASVWPPNFLMGGMPIGAATGLVAGIFAAVTVAPWSFSGVVTGIGVGSFMVQNAEAEGHSLLSGVGPPAALAHLVGSYLGPAPGVFIGGALLGGFIGGWVGFFVYSIWGTFRPISSLK